MTRGLSQDVEEEEDDEKEEEELEEEGEEEEWIVRDAMPLQVERKI